MPPGGPFDNSNRELDHTAIRFLGVPGSMPIAGADQRACTTPMTSSPDAKAWSCSEGLTAEAARRRRR
jgi:hypothetical protein